MEKERQEVVKGLVKLFKAFKKPVIKTKDDASKARIPLRIQTTSITLAMTLMSSTVSPIWQMSLLDCNVL